MLAASHAMYVRNVDFRRIAALSYENSTTQEPAMLSERDPSSGGSSRDSPRGNAPATLFRAIPLYRLQIRAVTTHWSLRVPHPSFHQDPSSASKEAGVIRSRPPPG